MKDLYSRVHGNNVLPQAPAWLSQAASSAIQSRRSWQARLPLTPLHSFEQTKGGSQGGRRKRRGGSHGRMGRGARRWLPGILQAGGLDSPLLIAGRGCKPVLGAAPRVRGSRGEGVPALAAYMGHGARFLLLPRRAVSDVSVFHLEQKDVRNSRQREGAISQTDLSPLQWNISHQVKPSLFSN